MSFYEEEIKEMVSLLPKPNPFKSFGYTETHIWVTVHQAHFHDIIRSAKVVEENYPKQKTLWQFLEVYAKVDGQGILRARRVSPTEDIEFYFEKQYLPQFVNLVIDFRQKVLTLCDSI
eukprot:TRINITY_DN27131_c0_g1_i1.p1 TRINITY_DN27131_c0_g1~~TRINITY_DN27131_c0_g1_i1.p1  ORF type:complete len:118 (-),score=12.10 TRINITY_DN27131_c0_g1_i1:57-410(-)